jgi:hypothetical protein
MKTMIIMIVIFCGGCASVNAPVQIKGPIFDATLGDCFLVGHLGTGDMGAMKKCDCDTFTLLEYYQGTVIKYDPIISRTWTPVDSTKDFDYFLEKLEFYKDSTKNVKICGQDTTFDYIGDESTIGSRCYILTFCFYKNMNYTSVTNPPGDTGGFWDTIGTGSNKIIEHFFGYNGLE